MISCSTIVLVCFSTSSSVKSWPQFSHGAPIKSAKCLGLKETRSFISDPHFGQVNDIFVIGASEGVWNSDGQSHPCKRPRRDQRAKARRSQAPAQDRKHHHLRNPSVQEVMTGFVRWLLTTVNIYFFLDLRPSLAFARPSAQVDNLFWFDGIYYLVQTEPGPQTWLRALFFFFLCQTKKGRAVWHAPQALGDRLWNSPHR